MEVSVERRLCATVKFGLHGSEISAASGAALPFKGEAYYDRGLAYERKSDKQHAIADYRKALTLDPGNEKIKMALWGLGETP